MPSLSNAALSYASKGIQVFPLKEKGKTPIIPEGFHKATDDATQVKNWWERWKEANIGIVCGLGFFVLDVDGDEGRATLAELAKRHGPLPKTPCCETPGKKGKGKGLHFYFKNTKGVKQTKLKGYPGLETRANKGGEAGVAGGYVLPPPCIHPDGTGRYRWIHDIETTAMVEAPKWLLDIINGVAKAPAPVPVPEVYPWDDLCDEIDQIEDRARKYLYECEAATQGQGGHDKLLWACTALVHGFELTDGVAYRLLSEEYNPRCNPPWDLGNPTERKEFERKIREGRNDKRKARGWLLEEMQRDTEMHIKQGEAMAKVILKGLEKPATFNGVEVVCSGPMERAEDDIPEKPIREPSPEGLSHFIKAKPAISVVVADMSIPKVFTIPKELPYECLHPPGMVGEITDWILLNSYKPVPDYASSNTMGLVGAVVGRKCQYPGKSGLRTNLYIVSIGDSGSGKESPTRSLQALCQAAGPEVFNSLMGTRQLTSDSAIEQSLARSPSRLLTWDEIGHLIGAITDRNAPGHIKTILPCLMELYTKASDTYVGKEKVDVEPEIIIEPNCCLYGSTSPDILWRGISISHVRDGLIGRMVVVIGPTQFSRGVEGADLPPRPEHIKWLQDWFTFRPVAPVGMSDIEALTKNHVVTATVTPGAEQWFKLLDDFVYKTVRKAQENRDSSRHLWVRALENAKKWALTIAAADTNDRNYITINEQHARIGCITVAFRIAALAGHLEDRISENDIEAERKDMLRLIRESAPDGIHHTLLMRSTHRFKGDRKKILADLMDADQVRYTEIKTKGRPRKTYHCDEEEE